MKNTKKEKPYTLNEAEQRAALRLALRMIYDGLRFEPVKGGLKVTYKGVLFECVLLIELPDKVDEEELDEILTRASQRISKDCHPSIERYRLYE